MICSLNILTNTKFYPIDISLDNGYMEIMNTDNKDQATLPTVVEEKPINVRIEGGYLITTSLLELIH